MDKISPISVAKATFRISWAKKFRLITLASLMWIPFVVMVLIVELAAPFQDNAFMALALFFCAAHFVGFLIVLTTVYNTAIQVLRDEEAQMPSGLLNKIGRVALSVMLLMAIIIPTFLVIVAPQFAVLSLLAPEGGTITGAAAVGAILLLVLSLLVMYAIMFRFSIMLPAAAEGKWLSVPMTYKITKGHTLRIVGGYILTYLPALLLGIPTMFVGGVHFSTDSAFFGVLLFLPISVVISFVFAMMMVCNAVWYEKLRLRHNAAILAKRAEPQEAEREPEPA